MHRGAQGLRGAPVGKHCSSGMCPIYLRLLVKIFEEQKMRIRWNNSVADYFIISNGGKQAGVLFPVLFSL